MEKRGIIRFYIFKKILTVKKCSNVSAYKTNKEINSLYTRLYLQQQKIIIIHLWISLPRKFAGY